MSTAAERSDGRGTMFGEGSPVLAFDVGGTDTKSAIIDEAGRVLAVRRTPTPISDGDPAGAVIDHLAELAKQYRAAYPVLAPAAVGVSVPGLVDDAAGIGIFASNLGWHDAPIRERARHSLGTPIAFGHDVRAAGAAEHRLGAARGFDNALILAIGTGIAAAVIVDGHPLVSGGHAGELGHSLSDPNGERCACGATGCLETIASAGAITRRFRQLSGLTVDGAQDVIAAADSGDRDAKTVWERAVEALAEQIARAVALLAPEVIVVGGGLADAGPALFDPLSARLDDLLSFHRRPRLLTAMLGADAGLLGTALAARDLVDGARALPAIQPTNEASG